MKFAKKQQLADLAGEALQAAFNHGIMAEKHRAAAELEDCAKKEAHEAIAALYSFIDPPSKQETH